MRLRRFAVRGVLAGCVLAAAAMGACSSDDASSGAAPPPPAQDSGPAQEPDASCDPPRTSCDGVCVDTRTDVTHCGRCETACKIAETCADGACVRPVAYAVRKIFLGETDRTGTASSTAWKSFGEDIDGITSTAADAHGECKPVAGASTASRADGNGGIDNAWGRSIVPLFQSMSASPSKTISMNIEKGERTPMLVLGHYTLGNNAAKVATGWAFAEKTSSTPTWTTDEVRVLANAWTTGGAPIVTFTAASIVGGAFVSGDGSGSLLFDIGPTGKALRFHVARAHVTMTIATDGRSATNGTISGVIATAELKAAFMKMAGYVSPSLCSGSTINAIEQQIAQASDILHDGTQDPTKDCDGISIGLGFDAVAITPGAVGPEEGAQPDPCDAGGGG